MELGKFYDISIKAAQIWKNMGHDQESCEKLLAQMRKYKGKKSPFNQSYSKSDIPTIWWESVQRKDEWELSTLALRLLSVTPHSASCERSFSILGWFYGQRRTNLSLQKIEGMCKLHTYYITNSKKELPYYSVDISENLMHDKLITTINEISNELGGDLTEDDFELFSQNEIVNININPSQRTQPYNLDVTEEVDIECQIFNMERKENEFDEIIISDKRQTVILAPQYEDFDIEALVAKEISDNELHKD
jgi:hypothetical protein